MTSTDRLTRLRQTYDQLAKDWGNDPQRHDWGLEELEMFASKIKESGGSKVLDLGCGSGVHSRHLVNAGLDVVGLDLSPKMIEKAKTRVPEADFIVGDIGEIPFEDLAFDGVYARASLLHISKEDLDEVLKNIHKILKENGVLYVAVKEGEGEREVDEERYGQSIRRFYSFFNDEEMRKHLKEAGFEVEEARKFVRRENSIPWLLFLAKKV